MSKLAVQLLPDVQQQLNDQGVALSNPTLKTVIEQTLASAAAFNTRRAAARTS